MALASPGFSGGKYKFAPVFATVPLPGNLGCARQRFIGGTHVCFLFASAEGRFGSPWRLPRLRFAYSRALTSGAKKTLYFSHQRKPKGSDCCSKGVRLIPLLPTPAELVQKSVCPIPSPRGWWVLGLFSTFQSMSRAGTGSFWFITVDGHPPRVSGHQSLMHFDILPAGRLLSAESNGND